MDNYEDSLYTEQYFNQRPHMNFFNKIYYTNFVKKWMPFYEYRSYHPFDRQRSAHWFGRAPQGSWVDGILDYTYNKHNTNSIGHFHMHENRKNKPQKSHSGGDATFERNFTHAVHDAVDLPRGCSNEIKIYSKCKESGNKECIQEKINIVEVCPKWALESLREKKKLALKCTVIDNKTYRSAMKIEPYNQGRTLRDLKDKDAHLRVIRSDGYWADDRYSPVAYPAADQQTNVVLGESLLYNDMLGGNRIALAEKERSTYSNMKAE
jgi:hypothetical protein